MSGCAAADENGVDTRLMQGPRKREMGLRMPSALRDGFEPCEALMGRFMEIDLLMAGDDFEA